MLLNYSHTTNNSDAALSYLQDQPTPTNWQVFKNSTLGTLGAPFAAASDVFSDVTGIPESPKDVELQNDVKTYQQIANSASGFRQDLLNLSGNFVGTVLNPIMAFPVAKAASLTVDGVSSLLDYGVQKGLLAQTPIVKGIGSLASSSAVGGVAGTILSVPNSVMNNYSTVNNTLNWGGVAKQSLIGGAQGLGIGLALGVLPFGYGLLKSKLANGEDITPEETKVASQDYNQVVKNPAKNVPLMQDAINKYINNDSVLQDTDQGEVHLKLMGLNDVNNLQSVLADNLSGDGEIDPSMLKTVLNTSQDLKNILNDPVVMNSLDESLNHFENLHADVEGGLKDLVNQRRSKIVDTLSKNIDISDKLLSSLKTQEPLDFIKNLKSKRFEGQSLPDKMRETQSKRYGQHLAEMDSLTQMHDTLEKYQKTINTIRQLQKVQNVANMEPEEIASNTSQYLNNRVGASQPLPQVEIEQVGKQSISQSKFGNSFLVSPETIKPEEIKEILPKGEKSASAGLDKIAKQIESLNKNGSVIDKLAQCFKDNIPWM